MVSLHSPYIFSIFHTLLSLPSILLFLIPSWENEKVSIDKVHSVPHVTESEIKHRKSRKLSACKSNTKKRPKLCRLFSFTLVCNLTNPHNNTHHHSSSPTLTTNNQHSKHINYFYCNLVTHLKWRCMLRNITVCCLLRSATSCTILIDCRRLLLIKMRYNCCCFDDFYIFFERSMRCWGTTETWKKGKIDLLSYKKISRAMKAFLLGSEEKRLA